MAPSFRVSVDVQFIIRVLSLLSVLQLSAKHHIDMRSLIITIIIITTVLHHGIMTPRCCTLIQQGHSSRVKDIAQ